jgi:hypothetical protein
VKNVARQPGVTLNFEQHVEGAVIVIAGTVEVLEPGAVPMSDLEHYFGKYAAAIVKDLNTTNEGFLADYSIPIRITPTRVRGWQGPSPPSRLSLSPPPVITSSPTSPLIESSPATPWPSWHSSNFGDH